MNALLTLIPFILIRIILFKKMDKEAYQRAQKFAPLVGNQRSYYIVYQICQLLLLILPIFYRVVIGTFFDLVGILFYGLGLILIYLSILAFTKPNQTGFSQSGVYQFSRHPMYVGYLIYYLGLSLWMHSFVYFAVLLVFQICTHQIIRAEEKWCENEFGNEYVEYRQNVRRYI